MLIWCPTVVSQHLSKSDNGVGWPDDCHGLSPILYDTAPLFIYTDQLLCHCVFICSNVRYWLVYCMRWLLWCFCLLAESYETIHHYLISVFLSNFKMSIPPCTNLKTPNEDLLAMVLLLTNKGKHYARVIRRGPTQQLYQVRKSRWKLQTSSPQP